MGIKKDEDFDLANIILECQRGWEWVVVVVLVVVLIDDTDDDNENVGNNDDDDDYNDDDHVWLVVFMKRIS